MAGCIERAGKGTADERLVLLQTGGTPAICAYGNVLGEGFGW